ncbi:MAG: Smr/MutS family protein [Flavobacteriales bacterium]|nr:Smr/MutS family protein [Flavobacteriales bacterium]
MNFNVGDKVKVIDEISEGIIIRFEPIDKAIVEIDSFEYTYKISGLILIESYSAVIVSEKEIREKEASVEKKVSKKHQRKGVTVEVDLHIHELVDSALNMSNTEMLQLQLSKFRKELERAIQDRAAKVVFIHGVGEGVLCSAIRRELQHYSAVSFSEASYLEYGNGATEVIIYQNK